MSDIKYVLVEMIENDMTKMSGESIISGVFKGIRVYDPPNEDMLILLEDKKKEVTHILNINRYNVLSMQKFDGYTKILHCFKATEEDQKLALDKLADVIEELNKVDRTIEGDDNIIDTNTYSDVPEDVTVIKNISDTSTASKNPIYSGHRANKTTPIRTVVNKDPEPKFFKRSKNASKEALEKMEKKIMEIKAGTYQMKLPIVKGDDIEIAGGTEDSPYDERNFYMHG